VGRKEGGGLVEVEHEEFTVLAHVSPFERPVEGDGKAAQEAPGPNTTATVSQFAWPSVLSAAAPVSAESSASEMRA
jgi:hypothetical protein